MPAIPIDRTTAWSAWMNAKVAGANVGPAIIKADETINFGYVGRANDTSVTKTVSNRELANLADKQGYNAIRLWFMEQSPAFSNLALIAQTGWSPATDATLPSPMDGITSVYQWRERIKSILQTCADLKMGVILVLGFPSGAAITTYETTTNATTDSNHAALANFWVACINEFGSHSALIGIDPLNEPPAGPGISLDATRTAKYGWAKLAQDIITAVRNAEVAKNLDRPTPILVCCATGEQRNLRVFNIQNGNSQTLLIDSALTKPNWSTLTSTAGATGWIVYQFHFYEPLTVTHQGIFEGNWASLGFKYPTGTLRLIDRSWDADGNWVDESNNAISESWGTRVLRVNNTSELLVQWKDVINLSDQAKSRAGGKKQPIFLGEFSYVQPVLEKVYPPDDSRLTTTWPKTPYDLSTGVCKDGELKKYYPQWSDVNSHPKSRWITEFEVFTKNGQTWVRAYFDNLCRQTFGKTTVSNGTAIPAPLTPPTGGSSPHSRANSSLPSGTLYTYVSGFNIPVVSDTAVFDRTAAPLTWPASNFTNTVLVTVTAGKPGTEKFVVTKAQVTIQSDQYWIEYLSPDQTLKTGVYLDRSPTNTNGIDSFGRGADEFYPPIAIASFFSATSAADIETSRAMYIQDTLCAAQSSGFSWAYHAAGSSQIGFIGWTPSPQMNDLLRQAALGRKLPIR